MRSSPLGCFPSPPRTPAVSWPGSAGWPPTWTPKTANTATYTALCAAYRLANRQVRDQPGALTSIVLMTDGLTNRGITEGEFRSLYRQLPRETRAVPTFTVKFGPADADDLREIARLTGGRMFSVKGTRLVTAFRQIRAYQ